MKSLVVFFLTILTFITTSLPQSGRFEHVTVYSQSLEGNLLGDSPNRSVSIYLPWQYDSNPTERFPVIYLLHGYIFTNSLFIDYFSLENNFNWFFNQSTSRPIIIVIPNAKNGYGGSWYTNSIVTGDWEVFITEELVEYIDNNYRTSPNRESRGISGHSMGGYGAMKLAMKHPNIYGAVYSLSPAFMVFDDVVLATMYSFLVQAVNASQFNGLPWEAQAMIAAGAAFSPNINPNPFYCDSPVDTTGILIDTTWQKWLGHDPYTLIDTYKDNLLQYSGNISFDCGDDDTYLFGSNCNFDTALTQKNISHHFYQFDGDHINKLQERIKFYMLPFFSDILVDIKVELNYIPIDFNLYQNHPNPFNPSTKIKYSIPQTSKVVVKVFDILGNEIETLLNEEKQADTYELTWFAEGLPSGIYFYQLNAGDYLKTKKMILLK